MLNIGYNNEENKETIIANHNDVINISHLKKMAYKTSYCVHCGSCEAECPTSVLNIFSKVDVDLYIYRSKGQKYQYGYIKKLQDN